MYNDFNYPFWPYSTDLSGVSDLDHTTFDAEFMLVARNNCYTGIGDNILAGSLNTVRDYAFKGNGLYSSPEFSDFMNGTGPPLHRHKQANMGSNWPFFPNANIKSKRHGVSFNDQFAEHLAWAKTARKDTLSTSKYFRSAAEFILATESP